MIGPSSLATKQHTSNSKLLTVSIVTYRPDLSVLKITFDSLSKALAPFSRDSIKIVIIDNSERDTVSPLVRLHLSNWTTEIRHGHGNIGFGRGHNLILMEIGQYHLILNPDIDMNSTALARAIEFMSDQPTCGLLSPKAFWPDGSRQYLCKRYPPIFDLLVRGFASDKVKGWFNGRLSRYEMRMETSDNVFWDPPISSGCFMFFRGDILRSLGGFDPSYMLYFEDFDLSIRAARVTKSAYVPSVELVHIGGHAGRKGFWHIQQFVRSGLIFYQKHGFKLF